MLSEPGAPERMHAALAAVLGPAALADVAPAELEALLRREQANSYGVMAAPGVRIVNSMPDRMLAQALSIRGLLPLSRACCHLQRPIWQVLCTN